jgi:opacity protein-like surface antigen
MKKLLSFLFLVFCSFRASSSLAADAPDKAGAYIGLFGGYGSARSASLQQKGGVYDPAPGLRFLPINASGDTGSKSLALAGIQAGYEWAGWKLARSQWGLKPAAELEGIYLGKHSPVGTMPIIPRFLGTQYVTIPMTAGVFLANAVFTLQTPYSSKVFPYLGVGAGIAHISIKGSDSANPSEPGINHFNSNPDASDSAFAMQLKAGLKAEVDKNLSLFAEYRYLSIYSTSYTFGSTDYPGVHQPTAPWHVDLGRQNYKLFVAGLRYKF